MFTLAQLESRLKNAREIIRARDLAKTGITVEEKQETCWRGKAASSGGEPYPVELHVDLTGTCDCVAWHTSGARRFCKHLAAVAILWLETAGANPDLAASLDNALADDADLRGVVEHLSEEDLRRLLMEAAAMNNDLRRRLLSGTWKSATA